MLPRSTPLLAITHDVALTGSATALVTRDDYAKSQLAVPNSHSSSVSTLSLAETRLEAFRLNLDTEIACALSSFKNPGQCDRVISSRFAEFEEAPLVLPPLKLIGEYMPSTDMTLMTMMRSPRRKRPPCTSQLGEIPLPWVQPATNVLGNSAMTVEQTAAVIARRRLAIARQLEAGYVQASTLQAHPPLERQRTVCLSENSSKIRGVDPMAGGLFSRSADLCSTAHTRGIYEAALIDKKKVARNSPRR